MGNPLIKLLSNQIKCCWSKNDKCQKNRNERNSTKKTFGLTLLNQDVFFEGIISPIFCIGTEIQKKKLLEKLLSFKESNSNV